MKMPNVEKKQLAADLADAMTAIASDLRQDPNLVGPGLVAYLITMLQTYKDIIEAPPDLQLVPPRGEKRNG